MGNQYTAKSFKSGNSVAIRIPAALRIEADREWSVEERDGDLVLHPKDRPKRKFNIDKVWGIGKDLGLQFIKDEDRVFEHRPLLWEDPEWLAQVNKSKP